MEEQAQKRSTDCLYFLASPLTCKKGSECEYRHSESARLNPRDCWYWLSGNCLNPNCAFRHPPLEGFNGDKADSFYTPFSAAPTSKLNVACYFYFNAICAKGDQCPYLHDTFPTQKVSRLDPEAGANHPLENKISSGDTGPASVELPANPPAETSALIKTSSHLNEVSQQAVPSCALEERSPSAESILPEREELADNRVHSLELMDHNDQLSPYQSFEEVVKECVEQELDERWESSPGFDVLVDGGSEQLAYEDDVDFQLAQNRESELVHSHLPLEYDFDGSVCYDHIGYPDTGYLYDELYENYDHTDDIYAADYFQHNSELPREERIFEPMYDHHRKQKLLRRVHEVHARDDVMDLREHLKYSRMDARWLPVNSRKRHRSHARGAARARSQERPTRRGINGSIHCRLASQVGRCMITSSQGEDVDTCKDHDRQGWQGHSGTGKFARSRLRERERRRHKNPRISSEVQQSSALDAEESAKTLSNGFAGPKSLAQIKEEKSRAKADYMNSQDFIPRLRRRQATVDFEGPKPLEELLRDKRRSEKPRAKLEHIDVSCQVKNRTSDAEINDWQYHEAAAGKQDREFVNGYQDDECADAVGSGGDYDDGIDDDDDDDNDVFRTKLARILSH